MVSLKSIGYNFAVITISRSLCNHLPVLLHWHITCIVVVGGGGGVMFVCVCVCAQLLSHVQIFVTPWTIAPQARLSMEFSRQEYCRGLPCPTPQDLPNPGIECTSPSLTGRFFTTAPPGKLTLCSFNLNFLLFHLKMLCFLKITYFNKRGSPQMKIILLNCIGIVLHLMS